MKNSENKSTELIEKQQIGCSPLQKIGNEERGYFVALGTYRITDFHKTKDDLDSYLQNEPEDFIVRLVQTMLEMNEQGKQLQNQ